MVKKLIKSKKGSTLFLENSVLELMGLRPDGLVKLTLDHGCLIVNPVHPKTVTDERFQACLDRVMAEHHELFKKLTD